MNPATLSFRLGGVGGRVGELTPTLLLVLVLLFPINYFVQYHLVIIAFLLGTLMLHRRPVWSVWVGFFLSLIAYVIFVSFIDLFFASSNTARNIAEAFRWVIPLLIVLQYARVTPDIDVLIRICSMYALAALLVSLGQSLDLALVERVTRLYGAEHHIESALGVSRRALGLSPGPGQNGAIMVVLYAIGLAHWFLAETHRKWSFALMLYSASVILLSQSQTAFIVLVGLSLYALLYFGLKRSTRLVKLRVAQMFLLFVSVSIVLSHFFFDRLRYLSSLFVHGLERSAYVRRIAKSEEVFKDIIENPLLFMLGHSKDGMGEVSRAMDNEYLYFLSVYGVLVLMFLLFAYVANIYLSWVRPLAKVDPAFVMFHFLIVVGVVMSWPSAFLIDPRVLALLAIVASMYLYARRPANARTAR